MIRLFTPKENKLYFKNDDLTRMNEPVLWAKHDVACYSMEATIMENKFSKKAKARSKKYKKAIKYAELAIGIHHQLNCCDYKHQRPLYVHLKLIHSSLLALKSLSDLQYIMTDKEKDLLLNIGMIKSSELDSYDEEIINNEMNTYQLCCELLKVGTKIFEKAVKEREREYGNLDLIRYKKAFTEIQDSNKR